MAQNSGTLVIAPIRPASDQDTFPAFHANDGLGGFHSVATLVDRDAIPADRRLVGMRCWVEVEQKTYRLTATDTWVDAAEGGGVPQAPVLYGEDFATNECFSLQDGEALHISSTDANAPWVDGITLQSGSAGQSYPAALQAQQVYTTPLTLPNARVLFLGQDGKLTSVVPTKAAGDVWLVRVARRSTDTQFVFAPSTPIRLA